MAARAKMAMRLSWMTAALGLGLFAVDRFTGVPATADSMMTLVLLGGLGALAGWLGGASMAKGAARVLVWGALAMAATAMIGKLFGATLA